MVELAGPIVASANEREHLASVGVERHQRDLRVGDVRGDLRDHLAALLHAMGVQLAHLIVHLLHHGLDRLGGSVLKLRVERGVDAQALSVHVLVAELLHQLLMNEIDEIGGLAGVHIPGREPDGLGLGAVRFVPGDGVCVYHRIEHQVAPLHGAVVVLERREIIRPLDHARDQGALRQVELANVLAEVGLRRLAETVDAEAAALAEVDLVGVHLENLLLVEARLQLKGDHDLDDLARVSLLRRQEESARQLHGQRRSALRLFAPGDVCERRGGEPVVVDAAVLEEAAVLDGEHRLHQMRGDFVVGDQAALGARLVFRQAGDQQRLELIGLEGGAVVSFNVLHQAIPGDNGRAVLGVVGLRTGLDFDGLSLAGRACPGGHVGAQLVGPKLR